MGVLSGVRVLDLSIWRPGPYATQLLVELGADVVKVEPPGGDPMRTYPELFASLHAGKRSIALDLKSDEGRTRALELAREADVVIEGYRPGVAARLGVAYEAVRAVNPSVVYCSVSGLGQDGPLALVPGHDLNYQAWAGALAPDGGEPVMAAVPVADLAGGMAAAFGICAAMVRRLQTGEGEYVDVSMTDVLATWTGSASSRAEGVEQSARGVPGYGMFEAANGWLTLGIISEDHFWRALCGAVGMEDCAELGFVDRMARVTELQARLTEAIRTRDRDELVADLVAADVPVAPVLDRAGMLELDHLRERGLVHDEAWSAPTTGHPVRFTNTPAQPRSAPPALDEHRGEGFRPRS